MAKLFVQEFISVKSVVSIVSWLLFAMSLTLGCTLFYFLNSLDSHISDEVKQRLNLARNMEVNIAKRILAEYTYWDEAYERIYIENDLEWVNNYSGRFIMDYNEFDFSLALKEGNNEVYFVKNELTQDLMLDSLMANGLAEMIQQSKTQESVTRLTSGMLKIGQHVFLVVGGPVISEAQALPRENTYMAVGRIIDEQYLNEVAENYLIPGLKIIPDTPNSNSQQSLTSPHGVHLASLSWDAPSPSREILPIVSLLLILFTTSTIIITNYLFKRAQADRESYENRLFEEATTDALTKISNRRYFYERGYNVFREYVRQKKKLGVLILDMDYFKLLNDNYGHAFGDKALIHFAGICREELREIDIFGRVGGKNLPLSCLMSMSNKR